MIGSDEITLKDWMIVHADYKNNKLFHAWLFLVNPELSVRHEESDTYYKTLFGTKMPTKKAIMDVLSSPSCLRTS